jgi:predicted N-acetyltransferase YhbS
VKTASRKRLIAPPKMLYTDRMWNIRAESPDDCDAIARLVTECFGPGREAKTAYRLREGVACEERLSFVAVRAEGENAGALLGSVRFWPVLAGGTPSLLLGPLAVEPVLRGRGIGLGLMRHGIEAARRFGAGSIILVGDEPYYARVGFARLPPGRLRFPGPVDAARVLGLGLRPGALEALSGPLERARSDDAVSAQSAPLGRAAR